MTQQIEKETWMDKLHEKTEMGGNCGFSKFIILLFASFAKKGLGDTYDVFLLNTLITPFRALQSTFSSLGMHSKRRYRICICLVILGEVESFQKA